ncbi:DNA polymerase III subunit beta [Ornithinibacillus massiliensis]|uniref:Beta sliding clamp n=1 Tax=Ornithinibacillus massiliensis TaxID=1944633 RepID=A0ABS5MFA9_9BACI|nr:DNA polymerase III subunit beta [Ornithinibacillus massiliensis]MBS3681025.1 DNA polymerase III subunit beta [Ornithinibacillus massiliensis]
MEFTINNNYFSKAITEVSHVVSSKATLPILTGIKMEAKPDCIILTGSNSDILIQRTIPQIIDGVQVLEVHSIGSIVVSAIYLREIIKKLPRDIKLTLSDNHYITIQSEDIMTRLNGIRAEEYPHLPMINQTNRIRIYSDKLIDAIKKTVFAVSRSETKPVLTGVNLSFKQDELICMATNSHRFALCKLGIESNVTSSFTVPSAALQEVTKLFHANSMMNIIVSEDYMLFKSDNLTLYSRLIKGHYPDMTALITQSSKTNITVDTKQLLQGIDRACLFASERKNNTVQLTINHSQLKISSKSTEVGKIEETQKIGQLSGEQQVNVTLDGSYVIDALKEMKEDEVSIRFNGSMRPVILEPVGNTSQIHLISPVRTH